MSLGYGTVAKYRKKPVVIEAVRFDGKDYDVVRAGLGLTEHEFYEVDAEDRVDNPDAPADLWVAANAVWVSIEPGEWVIRDARGCYPCKPDIFEATYEPVDA